MKVMDIIKGTLDLLTHIHADLCVSQPVLLIGGECFAFQTILKGVENLFLRKISSFLKISNSLGYFGNLNIFNSHDLNCRTRLDIDSLLIAGEISLCNKNSSCWPNNQRILCVFG